MRKSTNKSGGLAQYINQKFFKLIQLA